MSYVLIIPDCRCYMPKLTNQNLLEVSMSLFFLFVIAEIIGAIMSNSLSLLGDAASMGVDVTTYLCNIYGEWAKNHNRRSTAQSRIILEVIIPGVSVLSLLGVTLYVLFDAIFILQNPRENNDVATDYLYGFAAVNLLIDLGCGYLFYVKGEQAFVEEQPVPRISLDTTITFDQDEDDFGHLEDDLDSFMNNKASADTVWNIFNTNNDTGNSSTTSSGSTITAAAGGGSYAPLNTTTSNNTNATSSPQSNCCSTTFTLWSLYFSTNLCCCISNTNITTMNTSIERRKNLNMMSAFTHIVGDTLRTVALFLAALVATLTGINGNICDAWAALLVTLTILVLCASLVRDIVAAASDIWYDEYSEAGPNGGSSSRSKSSRGNRGSGSSSGVYSRVNDIDCEDIHPDGECVEL